MKKITALGLSLLLVFSLAACGGKAAGGKANAQDPNETQDLDGVGDILIDDERFTVTLTGIRTDDRGGLHLYIESVSKSPDTDYTCAIDEVSINGVTIAGTYLWGIDANQTWEQPIDFSGDEFYGIDVGGYTDIALPFSIFESGTLEHAVDTTVHVYPYGEDKATRYERTPQPGDVVLVENDKVTVTVTGFDRDDPENYFIWLFYQNRTDKTSVFEINKCIVNGVTFDHWAEAGYHRIGPGECGFSRIALPKATLQENGITDVETFQTTFFAYDRDGRFNSDESEFATQDITLYP